MQNKHSSAIHFPPEAFQRALLTWYDAARRQLPWRAEAGETSDPYRVWLSEIMLQQTTVKAVIPYFERFLAKWRSAEALGAAPRDDILAAWAGLGYYSRARNLHACAQIVAREGFPRTEAGLRGLPGIGAYTAAAIAAIAFDEPAAVVDGNVERVLARVFALQTPFPSAKPSIRLLAARLTPRERPGDYAQAMMDLGATLCTPRGPSCLVCPVRTLCTASVQGEPERFPVRLAKAVRSVRRGDAFVILREGKSGLDILLRRRADKGLLGGMMEVPCTEWLADEKGNGALETTPSPNPLPKGRGLSDEASVAAFPLSSGERHSVRGDWKQAQTVNHTFTHFHLEMRIFAAELRAAMEAADAFGGEWAALPDLPKYALPTVMKKAVIAGLKALGVGSPQSHAAGRAVRSASTVSKVEQSARPSTRAGRK
jgi:A/G-specific adenine glycosylase